MAFRKKSAVKKAVAKKAIAKPSASAGVPLKVVLDSAVDTPSHYVNYAELHHSQHEFGIALIRLPSKLPAERLADAMKAGQLTVNADILLLMPPTLIPGLITALQTQLAAYESAFGKVRAGVVA